MPFSPHSTAPSNPYLKEEKVIRGQLAVGRAFLTIYAGTVKLARTSDCPKFLAVNLPLMLLKVTNLKVNELKQVSNGKNTFALPRFD